MLLERRLQPLAPARDDQVDHAVLGRQLAQLVAVAAGDDRDGPVGHPAAPAAASAATWASTAFEWRRHRGPAQHDRVAGLEAERRAVHGHVGARLVDHGHHPERHAHAPHVQAVLEPVAVDRLAHRVGQRGDRAHVAGDARQPLLVELQPVEQARVRARPRAPASMSRALASRISCARSSTASAIASSAAFAGAPSSGGQRARRASRARGADLGYRRWPSWPCAKGTRRSHAGEPRLRTAVRPSRRGRAPRPRPPSARRGSAGRRSRAARAISATRPTQTPDDPEVERQREQRDRHERAERRGEHAPHQEARVARPDEDAVEREHRPVGGLHQREQRPDLLRAVDHGRRRS